MKMRERSPPIASDIKFIVILNINSLLYIPEQGNVPTTKVGLIKMDMDVMRILHIQVLMDAY